jgi:hypothetical protein
MFVTGEARQTSSRNGAQIMRCSNFVAIGREADISQDRKSVAFDAVDGAAEMGPLRQFTVWIIASHMGD